MTRTNILSMVRGHCFESWGFNLLTTRGGFYYWKDLPRRRLSYRHMQGTCPKWLSWEWGLCTGSTDSHTTLCTPEEAGLPSPSAELSTCFTAPSPTAFFSWDKEQQDRKKAATAWANCLSNLGKASFKTWHSSWMSHSLLHTVLRGEAKGSSQAWLALGGAWSCSDHSWVSHPLSHLLSGVAEQPHAVPFLHCPQKLPWSWLPE